MHRNNRQQPLYILYNKVLHQNSIVIRFKLYRLEACHQVLLTMLFKLLVQLTINQICKTRLPLSRKISNSEEIHNSVCTS